MNNKTLTKVLIWGFLFLYILIAGVSFFHAIEFFGIGNVKWMSVILSIGFEVGLALSLAAVLLSEDNKKNVLPWILMIVLCAVQCCGNVYSTYKYISLSETEYYQYLAKPLLFWMEGVTQDTVQIIVSWIIGAILPIIALFMTDMVATNIKNLDKLENKSPVQETETETPVEEEKPAKGQITIPKSFPRAEEEKPVVQEENVVRQDENDVHDEISETTDFPETAVQEEQVPAVEQKQKGKFLQRLKNMWMK